MPNNEHENNQETVQSNMGEPQIDNQQDVNVDLDTRSFSNHEPQLLSDDRDVETATELTPEKDHVHHTEADDNADMGIKTNSVMGWIAVALAIVSFFTLPVIFGGSAIILGFIARNRGAEWLGNTAIAAGVISIIISLFITPFI